MTAAARSFDAVPLEPELERQIGALARLTGVSRADVIQECVRDRLTGGTFPAPFPVKHRTDLEARAS